MTMSLQILEISKQGSHNFQHIQQTLMENSGAGHTSNVFMCIKAHTFWVLGRAKNQLFVQQSSLSVRVGVSALYHVNYRWEE